MYLCSRFGKNTRNQMQTIRFCFDKMMRAGVKLAMLTGVAFTFAACYGPPPERYYQDNQEFETDSQKVEQQLVVEQEAE